MSPVAVSVVAPLSLFPPPTGASDKLSWGDPRVSPPSLLPPALLPLLTVVATIRSADLIYCQCQLPPEPFIGYQRLRGQINTGNSENPPRT